MLYDVRGLELTTEIPEAVDLYSATVDDYLAFSQSTGQNLKATLSADPTMPMALILQGYFMHLMSNPKLEPRAFTACEAAEKAIQKKGGTKREILYLKALKAWNAGDMKATLRVMEEILLSWPLDVLIIRIAGFFNFYLYGGAAMRESTSRILQAWTEEDQGYGYVLGTHAFSLEESGDYIAAESVGKKAVDINPKDIWATHAVAHVMEMQSREKDGIAWLEHLSGNWSDVNNFRFHAWWHLALFYLELNNQDAVLDLYDKKIRSESTEEYLDITNGAALLWRLEDRGVDVGDRWIELADVSERHLNDNLLAFADAHYMMALAGDLRHDAAKQMLEALEATASAGITTQSIVDREITIPISRATLALSQGKPKAALDILLPLRDSIRLIGGSHAQRDVWHQMLIRSALASEEWSIAKNLLAQRTSMRPKNAWGWEMFATALKGAGDDEGANDATLKAANLLSA